MPPYRQYATISPNILLFLKGLDWVLFPQIGWRNESKQVTIWNSIIVCTLIKALAGNIADSSFTIYYFDLYWEDSLFLDSYFE